MRKVGVIGGSGYIGSHVTKKFLQEGYKVKVSSTDIGDKSKYNHLLNLPESENLEVSPLNIEDKKLLESFIKDCEILIHGGTPFRLEVEDPEKDMFNPTVKGTENFLEAVKKSPSVKKVLFIASVAALNAAFPLPADNQKSDHIYSEEDEPFIKAEHLPYTQAKHYADQTVRSFIKNNPEIKFEIVSVYPTLVVGSPLSKTRKSESVESQVVFKKNEAPTPLIQMLFDMDVEFAMVDVEDVAKAIYKAAIKENNHGEKYLLSSESFKISDIHRMMNDQKPKNSSIFKYSGKKAEKELGLNFQSVDIPLSSFSV